MLELKNISTCYGGAEAIIDVSLSVKEGEALALLGRNGAGKTTTIRTIMGQLPPAKGTVLLNEKPITDLTADAIANLGIGYVPEDRRVFAGLDVSENLEVASKPGPGGTKKWNLQRLFELFPEIARRRNALAGTLSGGEQQMLSIARAMMGNPSLLLLDEPSEGLAPVVVQRLDAALTVLRNEGLAMIVAEQNLQFARNVSQEVVILETGRAEFSGTFSELDEEPAIAHRLLGV